MATKVHFRWLVCALILACSTSCGLYPGVHAQHHPGVRRPDATPTPRRSQATSLVLSSSGRRRPASGGTSPAPRRTSDLNAGRRRPGSSGASNGRRDTSARNVDRAPESVSVTNWGTMFLHRIHAPACTNNMVAVVAWIVQVHGRAGWNPLDATAPVGGSWVDRSGVRGYPSLRAGLEGTVRTLGHGGTGTGYATIVRDLRGCAPALTTARAIQQSSWCPGCDGGTYVVGRIPGLIAASTAQGSSSGQPGSGPQQMAALIASIWGSGTAGARAECIASHESGDDPNNVNPSSGSAGLFQLMSFWWDGNNRFGWKFDPYDPQQNAYYAHLIWLQDGWTPWTTARFCA